jgi:WD40 repeat protein
VSSITSDSTSKLLFSGSIGCFKMWSIEESKCEKKITNAHEGYIYNIKVSPCNTWVFTVGQDGHLKQWNILQDLDLTKDYGKIHSDWIRGLCISPNGDYVFTAGIDGAMRQYSIKDCKVQVDYGRISQKGIAWIDISENGRDVFVGGADKHLRVFEVGESKEKNWYAM